jgi:1-acyl-sn-glycerol-3-phosphate acyltransferase
METKMKKGKVLVLFPEGTTGDGLQVKPFKSGFLSFVESHDLPVQPVTIAYTHIGTTPLSAETREDVAWIGEASFVVHFLHLLRLPYIQVTAHYFDVQKRAAYEDRKELAKACETIIAGGLKTLLGANHVTG